MLFPAYILKHLPVCVCKWSMYKLVSMFKWSTSRGQLIIHIVLSLYQRPCNRNFTAKYRNKYKNLVKMKLLNYCEEDWKQKILSLPKLRTCVNFKQNFELEPYVSMNLNKQERSVMAQFKCGILPPYRNLLLFEWTFLKIMQWWMNGWRKSFSALL